jgi:hypothetical protein
MRRARLAPAMISTSGNRGLRRRQRRALPAWLLSGQHASRAASRQSLFGCAFAMAQAVARARWRRVPSARE